MLASKNKGFSLIEVMIVLAISAGLIIIAISTFSQRRRVASDDAAEQLVSSIQTVRNEAQNGLGPTNGADFAHNETFYGEAIQFSNGAGCANEAPCMIVSKLKANANGNSFSSYETYRVENSAGLEFFNPTVTGNGCSTQPTFQSCFTTPTNSIGVDLNYAVIIRNGSGAMFYYPFVSGNCIPSGCATNTVNRQGNLRQGLVSRQGNGDFEYYLNIDMTGGGSIGTSRP